MKESNKEKYLRLLSKENLKIDLFSLSDKELKALYTRICYLKVLSKENLDIDLNTFTNKELKKLYIKRQNLNRFSYHASKKADFEDTLKNGKLQFVTFRGISNVRPLTLKEYLMFEEFVKENPHMYGHFEPLG